MKTITYDESTRKLVPVEPTPDMAAQTAYNGTHYSDPFDFEDFKKDYAAMLAAAPAQPAAQDQGEVHSRERWTVMCGHWQDTTLAIHGERTGHIASGIDEDAAHAIVNAHNQGLPPIAAASAGQEV